MNTYAISTLKNKVLAMKEDISRYTQLLVEAQSQLVSMKENLSDLEDTLAILVDGDLEEENRQE